MRLSAHILIIIILILFPVAAYAQSEAGGEDIQLHNPQQKPVRGKYHFVTEEGDTTVMIVLNNITVFPPLKFKNKKQEQFYWRTVRDVKRTLPYAKLISETLLETYEYIETFPTQKERERHLAEMEKGVFLGTFRAGFWQTFGRFFGVNLKSGYDPDKNDDDAIIERVCVMVEQGML